MVDSRNMYKADEIIRMYGFKRLEILFLLATYHFLSNNQRKLKLDHHKSIVIWRFGHVGDNCGRVSVRDASDVQEPQGVFFFFFFLQNGISVAWTKKFAYWPHVFSSTNHFFNKNFFFFFFLLI